MKSIAFNKNYFSKKFKYRHNIMCIEIQLLTKGKMLFGRDNKPAKTKLTCILTHGV